MMRILICGVWLASASVAFAVDGCPDKTTSPVGQHDPCAANACEKPYACRPTKLGCACELAGDPLVTKAPAKAPTKPK